MGREELEAASTRQLREFCYKGKQRKEVIAGREVDKAKVFRFIFQ